MDYVPIMIDFEPKYICQYTGGDNLEVSWNYDDLIPRYDQVLQDFDMDITTGIFFLPPQRSASGYRTGITDTCSIRRSVQWKRTNMRC